jgi:hypothetical protein
MIGLIPCAGRATRLGGLPKFLLPCGTNLSSPSTRGGALCLMSRLIIDMRKYCVRIVVPSSPTNDELIKTYVLPQLPRNVRDHVDVLDIGITDTMTETVLRARDWIRSLTPDCCPYILCKPSNGPHEDIVDAIAVLFTGLSQDKAQFINNID